MKIAAERIAGMKELRAVYVIQDGAKFYVSTEPGDGSMAAVFTWPGNVPDGDVKAARQARAWFMRRCVEFNYKPYFEGA